MSTAQPHPAPEGTPKWVPRPALGLVLSGALLAGLLSVVPARETIAALASFSWPLLLACAAILYLTLPLRALQWWLLLGKEGRVPFPIVLKALCLGYTWNVLLPLRGGEVVRAVALARTSSRSLEYGLTSVVLTRLVDVPFLGVLGLGALVAIVQGGAPTVGPDSNGFSALATEAFRALRVMLAAGCGGIGLLALLVLYPRRCAGLFLSIANRFPDRSRNWLELRLTRVLDALSGCRDVTALVRSCMVTGMCWLLYVVVPIPLLLGLGLSPSAALVTALAITGCGAFAQTLPVTPGGVGTFHSACFLAIRETAPTIDGSTAVAFAIVLHAVGVLGPALPGIVLQARIARWKR